MIKPTGSALNGDLLLLLMMLEEAVVTLTADFSDVHDEMKI